MESDERFRLVFCFQRLWGVLRGSRGWRLDYFGSSRCGSGCSGGGLSFLAAATHFTWVVRRAAIFSQGAGRGCVNHRGGDFGYHWCFNHWRRLGNHHRSGFNHFGNRCWRFFCHRGRGRRFNRSGWLGSPLEGGLFFANFTHCRGGLFDNRRFNHGFNHWLRLNHRCRLDSGDFRCRLGFANRCNFHFRHHWGFDRGGCFDDWSFNYRRFNCRGLNHWRFNCWRFGDWRFYSRGVFDGASG